jgi:hypothetical protein
MAWCDEVAQVSLLPQTKPFTPRMMASTSALRFSSNSASSFAPPEYFLTTACIIPSHYPIPSEGGSDGPVATDEG